MFLVFKIEHTDCLSASAGGVGLSRPIVVPARHAI